MATSRRRFSERVPNPAAFDDAAHIVNGLRRIVRAIEKYSHDVRHVFGLTGPQLWALKTLHRDGPVTTSGLAAALAVQPSSLSLLVDRLAHRGLVERLRSASDRRIVTIRLTGGGKRLVARAPEPAQGRLLHGLRNMPTRQRRATRRVVASLVTIMEADAVEAPFFFSDG